MLIKNPLDTRKKRGRNGRFLNHISIDTNDLTFGKCSRCIAGVISGKHPRHIGRESPRNRATANPCVKRSVNRSTATC